MNSLRFSILPFLLLLAVATSAHSQANKLTVLWCDPLRNIEKLSSRRGILEILNNAQSAGFQAVALGVKTISGHVIYESKIAPRLLEWQKFRVPLDFDPVAVFIEQARQRKLQVYAVYPMFSEGHMLERVGPLYNERESWQSMVYVVENDEPQIVPITRWARGSVAFANPHLAEVQNYEISVIKEFIEKYSFDGIVFDKVRFSGIEADFSDATKRHFEQFLGGPKVDWWPEDVFEWQSSNQTWEAVPGQYFQDWIEFRAKSIQTFMIRLITEIQQIDPTMPIGNFTGSWYPTYYEYGVNWASETSYPEANWAPPEYNKTAIAEKLNYSVVGCFFPRLTIQDAEQAGADWWMSVEGSATLSMEVVKQATPVYAAILVEQFKNNEELFKQSLQTALRLTNGLYVTDVSQIDKYEYWDEIRTVFGMPESTKPVLQKTR